MLAGQPGNPDRVFSASGIAAILDQYAKAHHGLAPIVISPDQNGDNTVNSLARRHDQGRTRGDDIRDRRRATVDQSATARVPAGADWAIGGFSQGGTCATQLGPRHPDIFGSIIAVDGELKPTAGSVEHMVAEIPTATAAPMRLKCRPTPSPTTRLPTRS